MLTGNDTKICTVHPLLSAGAAPCRTLPSPKIEPVADIPDWPIGGSKIPRLEIFVSIFAITAFQAYENARHRHSKTKDLFLSDFMFSLIQWKKVLLVDKSFTRLPATSVRLKKRKASNISFCRRDKSAVYERVHDPFKKAGLRHFSEIFTLRLLFFATTTHDKAGSSHVLSHPRRYRQPQASLTRTPNHLHSAQASHNRDLETGTSQLQLQPNHHTKPTWHQPQPSPSAPSSSPAKTPPLARPSPSPPPPIHPPPPHSHRT
ncbi:hypothetical protein B0T17DRAFT_256426 [Bombardia bombarda]|uniref:Uncharacterized protein n=1 Tax=Bombardia bombarda TaxID=252184 RepID=A0AA39X0A2_9PEZI|nr:hypothetical protein B0T17DRAFT_256426 [Bombardia bombarda]